MLPQEWKDEMTELGHHRELSDSYSEEDVTGIENPTMISDGLEESGSVATSLASTSNTPGPGASSPAPLSEQPLVRAIKERDALDGSGGKEYLCPVEGCSLISTTIWNCRKHLENVHQEELGRRERTSIPL